MGLIEKHVRNGGARTSKIHSSIKPVRTLVKKKKHQNQLFHNSGINQRLAAIHGAFIQEKWLNLWEQWALRHFNLYYSNPPLLGCTVALKNNSLTTPVVVKISSIAAIGGGRSIYPRVSNEYCCYSFSRYIYTLIDCFCGSCSLW